MTHVSGTVQALMLSNEEQKAWADSVHILFPTFEGSPMVFLLLTAP